jgi:hypothetical protein
MAQENASRESILPHAPETGDYSVIRVLESSTSRRAH